MIRRPFFADAPPVPKPISAARWLPVAKKHGMCIDFENRCVCSGAAKANFISEFWGDCFPEQDVGALVLRVAKMIADAKAEDVKPTAAGRCAGAPP